MRITMGMAVTICAIATALPARAETLRIEGIFAATAREASFLPTIGVDTLSGRAGEQLGMAIERQLQQLETSDVPHPRLVPISLRPDGLLRGRADVAVEENDYAEARERCTEKKDSKCVRRVTYRVGCTTRTIRLRADLQLVRRGDGRTLYAVPQTRDDSGSWCEDSGVEPIVGLAVDVMTESIARAVRLDLAPHRERYTIRVQENHDGLPRDTADRFRQAVHLTKTDQSAACRAFAEVDRIAPDNGSTLFNLALCAEAEGQYAVAGDLYTRARVFSPRAGGDISKGLGRVRSLTDGEADVKRMAAL